MNYYLGLQDKLFPFIFLFLYLSISFLQPNGHTTICLFSLVLIRAYLNRLNLYRQRIWTCKISGKANLTYEEALVSEKRATERVQEMPKELVAPALRIIQFSKKELLL